MRILNAVSTESGSLGSPC